MNNVSINDADGIHTPGALISVLRNGFRLAVAPPPSVWDISSIFRHRAASFLFPHYRGQRDLQSADSNYIYPDRRHVS